jgi:NAD(P)H-hydrate epimerase
LSLIKIVSVETTRAIEAAADAGGLSYDGLMQNAGRATADRILKALAEHAPADQARVTVLVGSGNNGGDGLVAARLVAAESDALVRCYLLKRRDEADPQLKAARDAGLFIANAEDDQRYRVLFNMVASTHVLVDALFGIGIRLPLQGEAQKLLRQVHAALEAARETTPESVIVPAATTQRVQLAGPYIIAVDVPSGLNADTGEADTLTIPADETVTFIAAKPGQFLFPGAAAVGTLVVAPIGVSPDVDGLKDEPQTLMSADAARLLLPERKPGSHKGTFGKALIVAGSVNYTGAPSLSAEAAYRIGAGLVTVAAPAPVVTTIAGHLREATWILLPHDMGVIALSAADVVRKELSRYDALLIGPGMGREATTGMMLDSLLRAPGGSQPKRRSIGFGPAPTDTQPTESSEPEPFPALVIDADGLYLLSQIEGWWKRLPPNTVITPHPGEMAQLTGLSVKEVEADRWNLARSKAAEWNVIVLLKGAHTVVAAPDGRLTVLPFKTAALSTAGTGDVLAGMITGLLAQGLQPYDAAIAGGYIHGLSGQLSEEEVGSRATIAGDIVSYALPQALALLNERF